MSNYNEFNAFAAAMRQLDMYIQDNGVKLPLLTVLEKQEGREGQQSFMDVSYESYSIQANYPSVILDIRFTGVKHSFNGIFSPRTHVGNMHIQLMVGTVGRILKEKVICVAVDVGYLQQIDVHA